MAAFSSRSRRHGLLAFSLLTLMLAATVGVALWHVVAGDSLARVGAAVAHLSALASAVRGVLIGSIALGWPRLLTWLQKRDSITAADQALLLAARWRIVGWLLIIELMLGQELLSHVVHAWSSAT